MEPGFCTQAAGDCDGSGSAAVSDLVESGIGFRPSLSFVRSLCLSGSRDHPLSDAALCKEIGPPAGCPEETPYSRQRERNVSMEAVRYLL